MSKMRLYAAILVVIMAVIFIAFYDFYKKRSHHLEVAPEHVSQETQPLKDGTPVPGEIKAKPLPGEPKQQTEIHPSALEGYASTVKSDRIETPRDRVQELTAKATTRIHGYVVRKKTGKPVKGAILELEAQDFRETHTTDTDGFYSFADAPPGDYTLFLRSDGGAVVALEKIRLQHNKDIEHDFLVSSGSRITGTVRDEEFGEPIIDADISLQMITHKDVPVTSIRTQEEGYYELDELFREGVYWLEAKAPGYGKISKRIALEDGEFSYAVDFQLSQGLSVAGTVVDSERKPVPNALIYARPLCEKGTQRPPFARVSSKTEEDGTFLIENIPAADRIRLGVLHPEHLQAHTHDIDARFDKTIQGISIVLGEKAAITGFVTDQNNVGILNAWVRIKPKEAKSSFGRFPMLLSRIQSDSTGKYVIRNIAAGDYLVTAWAAGFLKQTKEVKIASEKDTYTLDFRLEGGNFVSGTVMDEDSFPIAGAVIIAHGKSPQKTTTDEYGSFSIQGLGEEKNILIRAVAEGYESQIKTVAANSEDVMLTLSNAGGRGSIAGIVKRKSSPLIPKPSFRIFRVSKKGRIRPYFGKKKIEVNKFGEFVISDIPAGTYVIEVDAYGLAPVRTDEITVQHDTRTDDVIIEMGISGSLHGYVYDSSIGSGLAGATVSIEKTTHIPKTFQPRVNIGEGKTDENGYFIINDVPQGQHTITAAHKDFIPVTVRNISVSAGKTTEANKVYLNRKK